MNSTACENDSLNKGSSLLKLIYRFELMNFKFRFLLQLEFRLITGFKLSLVGAQPRHISSRLYLYPENSWINFFLGHDFAPLGVEKTLQWEEIPMAGIPVSQNLYAKCKEENDRGNFPALKKKGLEITYIIETIMNLVNTSRHSSIHLYPCNLGLLSILGKGLFFARLFFKQQRSP